MLLHHKQNSILGGDWNCITETNECTQFPDQKMFPTLKKINQPPQFKTLTRKFTLKANNFQDITQLKTTVVELPD